MLRKQSNRVTFSPNPDSWITLSNRRERLTKFSTPKGLAKYTDLFLRHEIDLETFAQLNEPDLKEIGVQTFGARKKLACLANSLSKLATDLSRAI